MPKGLTRAIIRDLSCDPMSNPQFTLFYQLMERASYWEDKVNNADPILSQAIKGAAGLLLNNISTDTDGLQFDLKMIESVGKSLEGELPVIKEKFSAIVTDITSFYGNIMKRMPTSEGSAELDQKAGYITHEMHTIAHNVETWARTSGNVVGTLTKLPFPKDVSNFLNDVRSTVLTAAQITTQISNVLELLWKNTTNAGDSAEALFNSMLGLPTQTHDQLKKKLLELPLIELKSLEFELSREKPEIQNSLSLIENGFQAVGIIASLFGQSRLANDITAVGKAATALVGNISTIIAGSSAGGPAMPIIAIAGTIVALVSHFMSDKEAQREDMILKAIGKLANHMDERFYRIEVMIEKSVNYLAEHIDLRFIELTKHIDIRLNRIDETLKYMYQDMLRKFAEIHKNAGDQLPTIQIKLNDLKKSIDYLHTAYDMKAFEQFEKDYINLREEALQTFNRDTEDFVKGHGNRYGRLKTWAEIHISNTTLAGDDSADKLVESINGNGISKYINKIRFEAGQLSPNISNVKRLVNPAAWADVARTIITYFAMTPKMYGYINPNTDILKHIDMIISEGKDVRNFTRAVQTDNQLFKKLIKKYKDALFEVLYQAYDDCITVDPNNPINIASNEPHEVLKHVAAIECCATFLKQEVCPKAKKADPTDIPELSVVNIVIPKDLTQEYPIYDNKYNKQGWWYYIGTHGMDTDENVDKLFVHIFNRVKFDQIQYIAHMRDFKSAGQVLAKFIKETNLKQLATN